jgi:hypothetical protein
MDGQVDRQREGWRDIHRWENRATDGTNRAYILAFSFAK